MAVTRVGGAMYQRSLPASPNWYCSRSSDVNSAGLLGVGAKNVVYLIDVSAASCTLEGELVGHRDLVSGFSFCQHPGLDHLCVSSSNDGRIRYWDSRSKSLLKEHEAHQSPVSAVHWSPTDKNLVVSGDEKGVVVCCWFHTGDTVSLFPEPRAIFCITCSPHTWNTVAVGYKDGMIVLIDVSKKGLVMQRLRGHDDEIHSLAWSPLPGEDALYSRPEDSEATNGEAAGLEKGCYLASGSKDQTVKIWSTVKSKAVMTLKMPYLKKRGSAVDPSVKERLWLNVHWPKGRATQLVSSCFSGELVLWDLTRTGKLRWTLLGTSSEGQNHSRIVFNMSSFLLPDNRQLLISTSMDRAIKCWDLDSLDCCWTLPTLGGFVYSLTFSPVGTGCLALGVGDQMIRVWNTLNTQNRYDTRSFWHGIKSKVTALAWHPKKEGSLSFGTDDGKVGIYEVYTTKPPQISSSYHRKTVYTLAWGPPVPPMSFGADRGKSTYSLYSCAGEGTILQHDPLKLSGEASDIDQLIRNTNNIKHKLSPHTDLSWKPDGKVVAIGNEDGCIDVYEAPSLKLLCSIQQHHKIINTLQWHHDHSSPPELHCLLASGSSNAIVYVHDLRSIIENPPESPVVVTEPYRRLCGHTDKITDLAWSPHHEARLVTTSYDGTAQVWDVLLEEGLSNYRGHNGSLLCVEWSPVDPDLIWTGGRDFTAQEWRVSTQEFTVPPKGKKMTRLKEKRANPKQKKPSGPVEVNGGPVAEAEKTVTGPEQSGEEDDGSSTSSSVPPPAASEMQRKPSAVPKPKDRTDTNLLKKKKPRSMLPLSTSMDHRPKEDLMQDCITLASVHHDHAPPAGCVPGQGEHIHFGLFSDRQALNRMFLSEEKGHLEAGHFESVVYLRLWSGDLEGALQLAIERGEMNDHLLSLAPMAGYEAWLRAVEAYVKQLCLQEQYLKAASHLLSINQVYEAIALLGAHKIYREAIALAKARLPADDPILKDLYIRWAAVLERDGHLSSAAKCYLAAGANFDAAKVLARKNDVSSLKTAAQLARISGEDALARSLAVRCTKDLAVAQNWVGAHGVLSSHESLLVHQLHLSTTELLTVMLEDAKLLPPTWSCSHAWSAPDKGLTTLQDQVRDVWEKVFDVSPASEGRRGAAALLQELKSLESPPPTPSVPIRQVLHYSSIHLTHSVLSWLLDDDEQLMKGLWQAVAWLRDAGHFSISAELLRRLFPDNDVTICSRKRPNTLHLSAEEGKAAANSLQAFVHYHRLYERWWSSSAHSKMVHSRLSLPATEFGARDKVEERVEEKVEDRESSESGQSAHSPTRDVDDLGHEASVLLSESHAACQATQRSMRQIQEQLAAMVQQHSGAQAGGQLEPGDQQADALTSSTSTTEPSDGHGSADAADGSDDPETLLSLSVRMTELQKELLDLPDTFQTFPHPDVLECCLVLLHLSESSPSVSESLREEAKVLLRKYGSAPSVQKASRRFLS